MSKVIFGFGVALAAAASIFASSDAQACSQSSNGTLNGTSADFFGTCFTPNGPIGLAVWNAGTGALVCLGGVNAYANGVLLGGIACSPPCSDFQSYIMEAFDQTTKTITTNEYGCPGR